MTLTPDSQFRLFDRSEGTSSLTYGLLMPGTQTPVHSKFSFRLKVLVIIPTDLSDTCRDPYGCADILGDILSKVQ